MANLSRHRHRRRSRWWTTGEQRDISGRRLKAVGLLLASMTRLDRITTIPAICYGKPTVRALRSVDLAK